MADDDANGRASAARADLAQCLDEPESNFRKSLLSWERRRRGSAEAPVRRNDTGILSRPHKGRLPSKLDGQKAMQPSIRDYHCSAVAADANGSRFPLAIHFL